MPLPKGYLPRHGDTLIIHAVVEFDVQKGDTDGDGNPNVHLSPAGATWKRFAIPLSDVVGIFARAWAVDDKVRYPAIGIGTIIATHGDQAWVSFSGSDELMTLHANDLEPAPDDETAPAITIPISEGGKSND